MEDLARGIFYHTPGIIGIIEAEPWNIPQVDFDRFFDNGRIKQAASVLEKFLLDPYILDDRPRDEVMNWLKEVEINHGKHVGDFYRRSCILPCRFVDIAASLEGIKGKYLGHDHDRVEWFRMEVVGMCYVDAPFLSARIAKAYECKRRAINFMRLLQ